MAKIKKKRVNIVIDMTPMVDVAFLLLTFFMLTTQFKPQEEVEVILPSSRSEQKVPTSNVMNITVEKKGRIFLGFDSQRIMAQLFGESYRTATSVEIKIQSLHDLVTQARISNSKLEAVIKSDADAEYGVVSDVMEVLQKNAIAKFSLVTDLEIPSKKE
ncbi:MAG: biopolymer transporter ExbD [Ignavibacteriaceae bacterium]|nr:biopolymer transporter ExbD [Ignavibacteriaceae bacterium]